MGSPKPRLWFLVLLTSMLGCAQRSSSSSSHAPLDAGTVKAATVMVTDSGATRGAPTLRDSGSGEPVGTTAAAAVSNDSGAKDAGSASMPVDAATAIRSSDAGAAHSGGPALDTEITNAVGSVDAKRIEMSIATLAGFTTRNTCSNNTSSGQAIGAARDWIQAQLQAAASFKVSLESFTASGCANRMATAQNVLAVKLGAHPERVIVIGGHYDSRAIDGTDPTTPAPGANDSGSQTAALLEIARVLAPLELDVTIVIAAFAGEEQGLLGSTQLAKDYAMFVAPNASVEAMLNMDIVGGDNTVNSETSLQQFRLFSPGTPREVNTAMGVTDDTSPARGIMRYVDYWGRLYVPSMTMVPVLREDRPGRGSDHEAFSNAGIAAVRFMETMESPNAGTMASHQHSPNDLPKYVTPSYTMRIAQVVSAVAASLARAPLPPKIESVSAANTLAIKWSAPASGPAVDHYVIAARPTSENFYHTRVIEPATSTSRQLMAAELGLTAGSAFFVSVASVDAAGHESLFSYPEYRCDSTGCSVQPGSLDTTARN